MEKELIERVKQIISDKEISLNNISEITWKNNPIARLRKGNDYLNPEIDLIADDSLNAESKTKLFSFLNIGYLNL